MRHLQALLALTALLALAALLRAATRLGGPPALSASAAPPPRAAAAVAAAVGAEAAALEAVLGELGVRPSGEACRLEGVLCEGGRVLELSLGSRGLGGRLSPGIGNLTSLRRLDLGRNRLAGAVPEHLGRLPRLASVWLQENDFGGPLPDSLGQLQELRELVLYGNRLSGSVPESLGRLRELRLLMLDRNAFRGTVPSGLFTLPRVSDLLLFNNSFQQLGSTDWRAMTSLKLVMLHNNPDMEGTLPLLPTSIEKLDLRNCKLRGGVPENWGPLPHLRVLSLGGGSGSQLLRNCSTWAPPRRCDGGRATGVLDLPSLTSLDVSGLPLACPLPVFVRAFGRSPLSTLKAARAGLSGVLDHSAFHTFYPSGAGCFDGPSRAYETLAHLDLSGNGLSAARWGLFPSERPPPALQVLSLADNALQEVDPEWLSPPYVVLTGNPLLRAKLLPSEGAAGCAQFWRRRHGGVPWRSESSWNPCLKQPPPGSSCADGLDGFTEPPVQSPLPRKVWADPPFYAGWNCGPAPAAGPEPTLPDHVDAPTAEARASILHLGTDPIAAGIAHAAVALGLPDELRSAPRSCGELAAALRLLEHAGGEARLCRLLQAAAVLGLANEHPEQTFSATLATSLLRSDLNGAGGAPSMGAFLRYWSVFGRYMERLQDTVVTGRTGPDILYGKPGWDGFFQVSQEENVLFDRAFSAIETRTAAIRAVPWPEGAFHMCDIGGAAGVDAGLLTAHRPQARVTILDVQKAESSGGMISALVHDMFAPFPRELWGACDIFWLDFVIQDFTDAQVVSLLRHLRVAAPPHAQVAFLNHVLGAHRRHFPEVERFKRSMDLWQMVAFGGRERSEHDFRHLLAASGWSLTRVVMISGEGSVVIGAAGASPVMELRPKSAVLPGPLLGHIGNGTQRQSLVLLRDDSGANPLWVLPEAADNENHYGEVPDMDFIGIWETVLPLPGQRLALLYCSKKLHAPAARIGSLGSSADGRQRLTWLGEPLAFAEGRAKTSEHFFAGRPPADFLCSMRVTGLALPDGRILACYIREGTAPGALCMLGAGDEQRLTGWTSSNIYKGVMAAPCSNPPMHRFASLKVVMAGADVVVLYTDGVLARGGGRCSSGPLDATAQCLGEGACNLWVRVLRVQGSGVDVAPATQALTGPVHMLDAVGLSPGNFAACYVAEPRLPEILSEGRCSAGALAGSELRFGAAVRMGERVADPSMAVVPGDTPRFVVSFEKEKSIVVMLGTVSRDGSSRVLLEPRDSAFLGFLRAQRPVSSSTNTSLLIAVADQSARNQPILLRIPLNVSGQSS